MLGLVSATLAKYVFSGCNKDMNLPEELDILLHLLLDMTRNLNSLVTQHQWPVNTFSHILVLQPVDLIHLMDSMRQGLPESLFTSLPEKKADNASDICPICINNFKLEEILKVLPCNHMFHKECIKQWFTSNVKCPVCRLELVFF